MVLKHRVSYNQDCLAVGRGFFFHDQNVGQGEGAVEGKHWAWRAQHLMSGIALGSATQPPACKPQQEVVC